MGKGSKFRLGGQETLPRQLAADCVSAGHVASTGLSSEAHKRDILEQI
jgi:hypothetical protein